jgi:hypothetical protein
VGSQQLLLILLGIIIVGIAIAVGFSVSARQAVNSNRDALVADLTNLSSNAQAYRMLPTAQGGGGGSYVGYQMSALLQSNENGSYALVSVSPDQIAFMGTSAQGFGTVVGSFGPSGQLVGTYSFTGRFQ